MKVCHIVISLFFLIFLSRCNSQESSEDISNNEKKETDSLIRDVPIRKNAERHNKIKSIIEKAMGLKSLQNGVDRVEIRIKYEYPFSDTVKLLRLEFNGTEWSGELYKLRFELNDKYDSLITFQSDLQIKRPISGWKVFIDSIAALGIFTLPDYTLIPNYEPSMDSDGLGVEIAKSNLYRFYAYPSVIYNERKHWQAQKMSQILKVIESEFAVKFF